MLMTPGPTEIPERVRKAMSRSIHNPDIDERFWDFYHELEDKVGEVYGTDKDILILGGEGILGLEASIASLMSKGEKALCISNGIFGDGFADFVEMYEGKPITCKSSYDKGIDVEKLKSILEKNEFKISTMVHCETPTGTLNDLEDILPLLKEEGILTIVDAVSSLGGTPVPVENIDICIGGSQKCFSSPPGLTTLSISEEAWEVVMSKKQRTFYTSLIPWKEMWLEEEYFPYTHLVSNLYALDESMNMIIEEGIEKVYKRHEEAAELCRERGKDIGISLYPKNEGLCSPTVTAFHMENKALQIQEEVHEQFDILLATSLGDLENDILRVGHMGFNAEKNKVNKTMNAIEKTFSQFE